jgi:hypothetical protein
MVMMVVGKQIAKAKPTITMETTNKIDLFPFALCATVALGGLVVF